MGTPRYMAPEQIRAELTDERTDQFSFAVALYDALYGVRPFEPKTLAERLTASEGGKIQAPPAGHGGPEGLGQARRRARGRCAASPRFSRPRTRSWWAAGWTRRPACPAWAPARPPPRWARACRCRTACRRGRPSRS